MGESSYFSNRLGDTVQTTSPLQTYLDLMAMEGRGEEAAMAVYEKYLKQQFTEATEQAADILIATPKLMNALASDL